MSQIQLRYLASISAAATMHTAYLEDHPPSLILHATDMSMEALAEAAGNWLIGQSVRIDPKASGKTVQHFCIVNYTGTTFRKKKDAPEGMEGYQAGYGRLPEAFIEHLAVFFSREDVGIMSGAKQVEALKSGERYLYLGQEEAAKTHCYLSMKNFLDKAPPPLVEGEEEVTSKPGSIANGLSIEMFHGGVYAQEKGKKK